MPTSHVNTAVPVYMSCLMPDYKVVKEQKKGFVCVEKDNLRRLSNRTGLRRWFKLVRQYSDLLVIFSYRFQTKALL